MLKKNKGKIIVSSILIMLPFAFSGKIKKTAGLLRYDKSCCFLNILCYYPFSLFCNCTYGVAVFGVNLLSVDFRVTSYLVVISLSGLEALLVYNLGF